MSDTPRTDAAAFPVMTWPSGDNPMVVRADFARQLERELDASNVQAYAFIAECHRTKDTLEAIIPALEAASGLNADEMRANCPDIELTRDEWAALWMARAILERESSSMECELAAATKERDDALAILGVYKVGCDQQKERIRRLEQAGDAIDPMRDNDCDCKPFSITLCQHCFDASMNWTKAKEARP